MQHTVSSQMQEKRGWNCVVSDDTKEKCWQVNS